MREFLKNLWNSKNNKKITKKPSRTPLKLEAQEQLEIFNKTVKNGENWIKSFWIGNNEKSSIHNFHALFMLQKVFNQIVLIKKNCNFFLQFFFICFRSDVKIIDIDGNLFSFKWKFQFFIWELREIYNLCGELFF